MLNVFGVKSPRDGTNARSSPRYSHGFKDDEDFEQDPPFKYEYGFNALRFVSDYLRANNPNNPDKDFVETYDDDDDDDNDDEGGEAGKTKLLDAAAKLLS